MKQRTLFIVLTISILLSVLPYIFAYRAAGDAQVFEGFLLNPIDGNSYLAKMQEGWQGQWKFTLPYTAKPGEGGYLFLFYIFLGHLSRLFSLPLVLTFHLSRVLAEVFLIITLYAFCQWVFKESRTWALRVFAWICLGAGMGWTLFAFGIVTTDLWVPEAYAFLSGYVNPHFPLGLALLLWILMWSEQDRLRYKVFIFLAGVALAVVLPFAVVVGLAILAVYSAWHWLETRKLLWKDVLAVFLGGGVYVLYQYWITTTDPVLAGWNAQNLTPSPAIWDLIVSFSPAILLAAPVFLKFRRWEFHYSKKLCVAWFISSLVLILFPFSLQRRFLLGFLIPVVVLAGIGIDQYFKSKRSQRRVYTLALALSLPSILVILMLGVFGITRLDQNLYMQKNEQTALTWLSQNSPQNAIVLAAPETGILIPAQTGRRVLYGHPFETVDAAAQKAKVTSLLTGELPAGAAIEEITALKLNYVFYGPSEKSYGSPAFLGSLPTVYQNPDVTIYAVK